MKLKLLSPTLMHKYQLRAFWKVIKFPCVGLFMEMGLGKTITIISAIQFLKYEKFKVNKVLVIAPLRVASMVWQQEAESWQHTKNLRFSKILGTEKQRLQALEVNADIYLINIDNIAWLTAYYGSNWPFDMIVIDESSKIKNHNSRRFKALKVVRPLAERVVILTGTPRPQGISDLWSQIYMLDGGERLGLSITSFRQRFLNSEAIIGAPKGIKKYSVSEDAEQQVYNRIKDICVSMKSSDYIELPARTDIDIVIPIPDNIYRDYQRFERDKVLELIDTDGVLTAANAAALSGKLRQYANGQVYYENEQEQKVSHKVHKLKLDALQDILEDTEDPVLCFYAFTHDRDRILAAFKKYKPRHLKTEKDFEDWNNGKIKLALGHLASMGHGLNLQKCPAKNRLTIIFYSPEWNLDFVLQGITRVFRQGLKSKLFVYKLALAKTIDLRIIQSNKDKEEGQNNLMTFVKEIIRKHKPLKLNR